MQKRQQPTLLVFKNLRDVDSPCCRCLLGRLGSAFEPDDCVGNLRLDSDGYFVSDNNYPMVDFCVILELHAICRVRGDDFRSILYHQPQVSAFFIAVTFALLPPDIANSLV